MDRSARLCRWKVSGKTVSHSRPRADAAVVLTESLFRTVLSRVNQGCSGSRNCPENLLTGSGTHSLLSLPALGFRGNDKVCLAKSMAHYMSYVRSEDTYDRGN